MMRERFAERMPITEWNGVEIRVSVGFNNLPSLTTQMILGRDQVDELVALEMPEELKAELDMYPNSATSHWKLLRWRQQSEEANKILNMISKQIAWSVGKTIRKGLKTKGQNSE